MLRCFSCGVSGHADDIYQLGSDVEVPMSQQRPGGIDQNFTCIRLFKRKALNPQPLILKPRPPPKVLDLERDPNVENFPYRSAGRQTRNLNLQTPQTTDPTTSLCRQNSGYTSSAVDDINPALPIIRRTPQFPGV